MITIKLQYAVIRRNRLDKALCMSILCIWTHGRPIGATHCLLTHDRSEYIKAIGKL